VSHNSICQCGDCFARKLNPQTTTPIMAPEAPVPLCTSCGEPLEALPGCGCTQEGQHHLVEVEVTSIEWPAQPGMVADNTLPEHVQGMEVIGAVLIKEGTTHALVLWDGTHQHMIYWERNATTHGRGEWAIVRL
jgi:hypothetical protein